MSYLSDRQPPGSRHRSAAILLLWLAPLLLPNLRAQSEWPPFYIDRTNLLTVIDSQRQARPVKTPADWEERRGHILANLQMVMGPVPNQWRDLPLELRVLEETNLARCVRKKITFRVEPDDQVTAYLLVPLDRRGKLPAMLCLHQTTEIGKEEPAGLGGNQDLHYALELAERGYITLAPDYWTFGDYRQKTYDPYQYGYVSGTMKGIWNHLRAVDLLQSLPEVDPERIGCIGHSLGGHNALWLAGFDRRLKVIVSSCGFNSMAAYAASAYSGGDLHNYAQQRYMPYITSRFGNDPRRVPFEWSEALAALAPRPVFVNAPLRDENFVVAGVRESVGAARTVYDWMGSGQNLVVVHPDAGHSFPMEVRQRAYAFIDQALRK
jgi:dienelactone hydrolase